MSKNIDQIFLQHCTPQRIVDEYWKYKRDRLDALLAQKFPTYLDVWMASGASYDDVMAVDDPGLLFPAENATAFIPTEKGLCSIPAREVQQAIRIPMGADGVTWQMFEANLQENARQIARRLQDGTYLFHPFRQIVIPKKESDQKHAQNCEYLKQLEVDDKVRVLAVASIRDTLVQRKLYRVLHEVAEHLFTELDQPTAYKPSPVSFAYRKGNSAQRAARTVRSHMLKGFIHVLDADLRKFFDTIPTDGLLRVCEQIVPVDSLVYKLLRRFICVDAISYYSYNWARTPSGEPCGVDIFQWRKAEYYEGTPASDRPQRVKRGAGVPQGGILSGLLANLYMHPFDHWLVSDLAARLPLRYVRYADDFVILTRSKETVLEVYSEVKKKIEAPFTESGLALQMHPLDFDNPDSSKTRYCNAWIQTVKFVGFGISPAKLQIHPDNIEKFRERWKKIVASEKELREKLPDRQQRLRRIVRQLRYKIFGHTRNEPCSDCKQPRMVRRSWMAFFSASTDWRQIKRLEKWMRIQIYRQFREDWPDLTYADLRNAGYPSIFREYRRLRSQKFICECTCNELSEVADQNSNEVVSSEQDS